MILANNIRYLRKAHNYSQDKLAELLGYKSFTTIQKWESGVAEPPFKTLAKLAEIFRVDIDDLAKVDLSDEDALAAAAIIDTDSLFIERYGQDVFDHALQYSRLDDRDQGKADGFVASLLEDDKYKKGESSDGKAI